MKNKSLLKVSILIVILFSQNNTAKAQWVTIPVGEFRQFLFIEYPTCMSGNQMDTTCAEIINDTLVDITFNSSYQMEGIQYFDNLKYLYCGSNALYDIPQLPNSLTYFDCSNNYLTNLPELPSGLKFLFCSGNDIEFLPELPIGLIDFNCSENQINSLPMLPSSLITLNCALNYLVEIPELPNSLESLNCYLNFSYGQLTLPTLPNSLKYLNCSINSIFYLPELPDSLRELNCSGNGLVELPFLPDSLEKLSCWQNQLTFLPVLPSKLTYLECSENQLISLPEMPNSIYMLNCFNNQLLTLPALPNSLSTFNCAINQLTFLPSLPSGINYFFCGGNQLTFLPELPDNLIEFECQHNQLDSLPWLPSYLHKINCSFNSLTTIPNFPNYYLTEVSCFYNELTSLPELPNTLSTLACSFNQLTSLPELPNSLEKLYCDSNQLNSLPELPLNLHQLYCQNNNITCFPKFPASLETTLIQNNPYTCIPNYVDFLNGIPICEFGDFIENPNNCENIQGIKGNLYKDVNENCVNDSSDILLENIPVHLYDEFNNLISTTYTTSNGEYNFYQFSGIFSVVTDTLNKPYKSSCPELGIDSTLSLIQNYISDSINFAISCKQGTELGIQSINRTGIIFPGQPHQLNIHAGNLLSWNNLTCNFSTSGTVQINVTGSVAYTGTPDNVLLPDAIDGNNFTYNIADFGAVPLNSFGLLFLTDTTAQAGEEICVTATVTPNGLDNDTSNNILTYCYPIVNSYDPNEKDVYPTSVLPNYDGYFTYTIHFQNTGTAPAINIKVQDTLSTNLDLSTFEITAYSHPNNTTLSGNLISFKFPNIWLPDSTSDLEGSKGFVQYRIKPIANLPVGTQITNTANIYFDFNAPIQTNTTESNFEIIQSLKTYSKGKVSVYPNPNNGIFHINMLEKNTNEKTMELTNIVGEKVWSQKIKSNTATIDINHLPKGLYILNVTDNDCYYR
jgi:uncharacterized repeat protein (TIGR01451 family)